jgi:hypothetical protein
VRALLALTVVGIVLKQTLAARPIGLLLSEALLIILAHYFASRRLLELPREVQARLEAEGVLVPEANPLWLPRHSVRVLILLGFSGTALVLWWQGRLFEPGAFDTIGLFVAYLGGVLFNWFRKWRSRSRPLKAGTPIWVHLKALAVLLAGGMLATLANSGEIGADSSWIEKLLLSLILFYFGTR